MLGLPQQGDIESALPTNLIESESFGHEKERFTCARDKRTELGNLNREIRAAFLDEVDELALELLIKLLRVLQEKGN